VTPADCAHDLPLDSYLMTATKQRLCILCAAGALASEAELAVRRKSHLAGACNHARRLRCAPALAPARLRTRRSAAAATPAQPCMTC
jgi:hypothetical protein